MTVLAIDVGSSSVKAAVLRNGRVVGRIAREAFSTGFDTGRAEVAPGELLGALATAVRSLGALTRRADVIALAGMSPSWLAMDRKGRPLTPIITHQDRRSVDEALWLECEIGQKRLLRLTGNRPFPGGISSTTARWVSQHRPGVMRRADLVGHVTTYLHRQLTGARVTDPSNASFMGVYDTLGLTGWHDELLAATGLSRSQMPEVVDASEVAGRLTASGANLLGLPAGLPMLAGVMDTSAAVLLTGAAEGQLINVCGTTDVLAMCVLRPKGHPRLLTRALGIGRKWLQVSTLASAGSTLNWLHATMFSEMTETRFHRVVAGVMLKKLHGAPTTVSHRGCKAKASFLPYLAGDRMSIDQPAGAFTDLTLGTSREDMLAAAMDALAGASAARLSLLRACGAPPKRSVLVSGGTGSAIADVLHRDWKGRWTFTLQREATLRGLAKLAEAGG